MVHRQPSAADGIKYAETFEAWLATRPAKALKRQVYRVAEMLSEPLAGHGAVSRVTKDVQIVRRLPIARQPIAA